MTVRAFLSDDFLYYYCRRVLLYHRTLGGLKWINVYVLLCEIVKALRLCATLWACTQFEIMFYFVIMLTLWECVHFWDFVLHCVVLFKTISTWHTSRASVCTISVSCVAPVRCLHRDRPHPGKYWNLIIRILSLEYTGILSKVLENTGLWAYLRSGFLPCLYLWCPLIIF